MIIIGYQGIGKTTLAAKRQDIIDLESSCFWKKMPDGKKEKPDDWYVYYCQIAMDLSKQGYVVFVSSHDDVMKFLKDKWQDVFIRFVCPAPELRNQWLKRLAERYANDQSEKNFNALDRARGCYDVDTEIMCYHREFYGTILESIDYNLEDIVDEFIKNGGKTNE